jgi:hypothetical protein
VAVGAVSPELTVLKLADRFQVEGDGCWSWLGTKNSDGYGVVRVDGRPMRGVHRVMYEAMRGEIPSGLQLDHLCRVRHCVNPDHLEPVTGRENSLRGEGPSAMNARKTICVRGHALTGDNLIAFANPRRRGCKTCHRERERARLARAQG